MPLMQHSYQEFAGGQFTSAVSTVLSTLLTVTLDLDLIKKISKSILAFVDYATFTLALA